MKMRVTLITLGTTLSTVAVIANAFYQKKQFYPSIVYLTKSNPSVAVLYAQVFVLVLLFGKAIRKIFFGQLRAAEVEHLIEKFWYVITETCLAFTVFRDDFSPKFVALFTFLLFTKAFHWLIEDRVDYMERSPVITKLFHFRVGSLLLILGTIDAVLIHHALKITISSGASVQMVFGFEYAILLVMVVAILMKYILHSIDYLSEHPWENKNVYLLYAELVTGFIKCLLYILFVGIMVKIHTFPLFAIRPMYLTIRGFKKSLSDVILSRRAITYMNTRFPDANEEELQQQDNTCIICREAMTSGKKLPCNHIFHAHCLRSWFQRQQSCPTCRLDVLSQAAQVPPPVPAMQQPPVSQPNAAPPPQVSAPGFVSMPMPMPPVPPPTGDGVPVGSGDPSNLNLPNGPHHHVSNPFLAGPPPPPFFMGTPPFLGSPFMPPPMFPMPLNLDMSALNVEQLQQMEGQERENIEARIRVLKNVHSLLDMAILQLNQYSQVISALNCMSSSASNAADPASTSVPPAGNPPPPTGSPPPPTGNPPPPIGNPPPPTGNPPPPTGNPPPPTGNPPPSAGNPSPPTGNPAGNPAGNPTGNSTGNPLSPNFPNTAPTQSAATYQTSSTIPCASVTCDSQNGKNNNSAKDDVTAKNSAKDDVTVTAVPGDDDVSSCQDTVEDIAAEDITMTSSDDISSNQSEENELRRRRLMKFATPKKEGEESNEESANQG